MDFATMNNLKSIIDFISIYSDENTFACLQKDLPIFICPLDDIDSPEFGVKRPDNRNQVSNRRPTTTTTTERSGITTSLMKYRLQLDILYLILQSRMKQLINHYFHSELSLGILWSMVSMYTNLRWKRNTNPYSIDCETATRCR